MKHLISLLVIMKMVLFLPIQAQTALYAYVDARGICHYTNLPGEGRYRLKKRVDPTVKEIEIKGIYLGMTKEAAIEKVGQIPVPPHSFTIGGVSNKDIMWKFHKNKLDHFEFYFNPIGFKFVVKAIKSKYPNLDCSESTVSNSMGAKFTQVNCILVTATSTLFLSRYAPDLTTSTLELLSERKMRELSKELKQSEKDI